MPTYIIRPESGLYSHVEYQTALKKEVPFRTVQVLSEAILDYENLTGTLSPGLDLTEAVSGEAGKILWAKGSASSGKIGLGELTGPFDGEQGVTGAGVTLDGKTVENPIERQAVDPDFANFISCEKFNITWSEEQATHFVDVRFTEKLFISNLSMGYIQACNRLDTNPLSIWIGPGKTVEIYCEQRVFRLLIVMSVADLEYNIAAIGEHSGLYKNLTPRRLKPPEPATQRKSVETKKSSRSRKKKI